MNDTEMTPQAPEPSSALKRLDRLVGTWTVRGGAQGTVTYQWMDGGFFLLQHAELEHDGRAITGIEVIGHERPFGAEPSEDIKSRFYDNTGSTLDYVYEIIGNKLMIWGGEKGSAVGSCGACYADGMADYGE